MELSLCMIVRNEARTLARCLESVSGAVDEIVILDTGSTDETKEIAGRYTDRVYDYVWQDDFSAARNASLALGTKPYLLWLDADDMLEREDRAKLIALKSRLDGSVDAVMTPYYYAFDDSGRPSFVFERERIIRADAGFRFEGAVHEAIAVGGRVLHEDVIVRHMRKGEENHTARNLAIYERQLAAGKPLSPRDRYYYARELMAAERLREAEEAFGQYLQGSGSAENRMDARMQRAECLRRLGKTDEAMRQLLLALDDGCPRAETLCAIGALCMGRDDEAAVFWYRAALLCGEPRTDSAFTQPAAYGYIPLMQLCVLYDRRGEHCEASRMNERALLLRPDDPAALRNRAYFEALFDRERIRCGGGTTETERMEG